MWAFEALRIARGEPRFGQDTDHRTIPNEVGWIPSAVHLDKGCYRGQETVARVHTLGRPPRRLTLLHLDGSDNRLPTRGAPVLHGEREVGFVGSSARHHEYGPIALALLKRNVPVDAAARRRRPARRAGGRGRPGGRPARAPAALKRRGVLAGAACDTGRVPTTSQWIAFVVASILFIQVPGPSLLFTIGRALTVGRRDALLSVVGNALGITVQVFLIAVGLAAVVTASATAYTVVKVVGASLRHLARHPGDPASRRRARSLGGRPVPADAGQALRTGFIVGLTNPKTSCSSWRSCRSSSTPRPVTSGCRWPCSGSSSARWRSARTPSGRWRRRKARDWFARKPHRLDTLGATGGVMMVGLGATMLTQE